MPPPEGFHEVLRIHLPAKIAIGRGVTIWPQPPEDISNLIASKFWVGNETLSALEFLSKRSFYFPADPHFDPLERFVTPGAGEAFRNELLDNTKISDPEQRHECHKILSNYIIPAHEAGGHVEINLNVEKSCFESKTIWLKLQECLTCPNLDEFLDFPSRASEEILFQHCISILSHELYALLKEESVWKTLGEQAKHEPTISKLKKKIRGEQDNLTVKLLQFLIDKSGNSMTKVQKIVDECVLKTNLSLSHFMPHLIRDLARGVEIDNYIDFVLEQTARKFSKEYPGDRLERAMRDQQKYEHEFALSPQIKAVLSTYMSLSYAESCFDISFYSQENGEYAVRAIPNLVTLWEAKKILERESWSYPISPLRSMEQVWTSTLEEIADGRFRDDRTGPLYHFDILKDFRDFYLTWRPALLLARKRVLGNSSLLDSGSTS